MNDTVLQGLIALARADVPIRIVIQVGGQWVGGMLITAATYKARLAERLGHDMGSEDANDESFIHLELTRDMIGALYRCHASAVQGYMVSHN